MEHRSGGAFEELEAVVRRLRRECPWDKVQTHESLAPCLVDETQEVLEAISLYGTTGQGESLCEELGDVLLSVVLHSIIAEEEGLFTMEDVIAGVSSKMKFRHPRIFSPEDEEACAMGWDELKEREKELRRNMMVMGRGLRKNP